MGSLSESHVSLWVGTTTQTGYPKLTGRLETDVVVIGAGVTGLTAAALLLDAGLRVVVLEADRIASGTTGYSTAKVSSLHGLIYADMVSRHGARTAQAY